MNNNQIAVYIDFENIALWAEDENINLKVTTLMEYLSSRGAVIVRRAYGDFSRYSKYRSDLMDNAVDMVQIFSFRSGKNLADIRMVVDAMEMVRSRPHINMFVVVSGDSDFTPLIARLREYGRYTIGIGPRKITHHLLVKGCDEFVYLETILGTTSPAAKEDEQTAQLDKVAARILLRKAIQAHGQRGDLPVYASKVKQTMLSMNSAFNEANFGYSQFKNWLEDNTDLIKLVYKDLQLYIAPIDYEIPGGFTKSSDTALEESPAPAESSEQTAAKSLRLQYDQVFSRLKLTAVDVPTRRLILSDIYYLLSSTEEKMTTDKVLEKLLEKYTSSLELTKGNIRSTWQMAFRQRAFLYEGQNVSMHIPVWLQEDITSPEALIQRAEGGFIYAVLHDNLELDRSLLAEFVCGDASKEEYVQNLMDAMVAREVIFVQGDWYGILSENNIPFVRDEPLAPVWKEILKTKLLPTYGTDEAAIEEIIHQAKSHQQKGSFSDAAQLYLHSARVFFEKIQDAPTSDRGENELIENLQYHMALYAAAQAGKLYREDHDYAGSRPFYLAFFYLAHEGNAIYGKLNRLVDPLLSYYWASGIRELGIDVNEWGVKSSDPIDIAIKAARHENPDVRKTWQGLTRDLAKVNQAVVDYIIEKVQKRIRGDAS